MTTYNKSGIMKRAWNNYKSCPWGYADFAHALRVSWADAKREVEERAQGYVTAAELNIGDTIEINCYGGYGDINFNAVIPGIEPYEISGSAKQYVIIRFGHDNDICKEITETIMRTAKAPAEVAAA